MALAHDICWQSGQEEPCEPRDLLGLAALGRAQHHQGGSWSTVEMQLSGASREGAKLTPLLSELLIFHMCRALAHGPRAELMPPSSAKLMPAPRALSEFQKVWLLLSAGLKSSLSFLASWAEA